MTFYNTSSCGNLFLILSCEPLDLFRLVYLVDRKNLPIFYVACSGFSLFITFLSATLFFFFLLIY